MYPKPQIGYYQAECCLLDLYKIETQADLEAAEERIAYNDEVGPLMVFPTLEGAIKQLRGEYDETIDDIEKSLINNVITNKEELE